MGNDNNKKSPMLEQYEQIKSENEDCILFFRLGDFYEMFFEDAKTVSEELDLVLTGKDCGLEERAPMCGVPYHSCEGYIARLVSRGYKVAICEQVEDPKKAKKLVQRKVVRIITPGTVIEESMLDESKNNYLASISFVGGNVGLCFTDASTGEAHVTEIAGDDKEKRIINEIMRFTPSEILISKETLKNPEIADYLKDSYTGSLTVRDDACFDGSITEMVMCKYFGVVSTENLGLTAGSALQSATGAVIDYLCEMGMHGDIAVNSIDVYTEKQYMRLNMATVRNLEVCETMRAKSKRGSLLWVLDRTKTAMGKRLIRSWLEQPLMNVASITHRQNAVSQLVCDTVSRLEISAMLVGIFDIERLMTKIVYGSANARELRSLCSAIENLPKIKEQKAL